MRTSELRIGNYIEGLYDSENELWDLCQVVALDSVEITDYTIWVESEKSNSEQFFEFIPIPLTEQWLIDFGFEKKDINWRDGSKSKGVFILENFLVEKTLYEGFIFAKITLSEMKQINYINTIEFVHQLQNLYFALTGKELTKKTQS